MSLTLCQNCGEETEGTQCAHCGAVVNPSAIPSTASQQPMSPAASNRRSGPPPLRHLVKPKQPSSRVRKERYLARIREESAYPTFRKLNEVLSGLLILLGILLLVLAAFVSAQSGSQLIPLVTIGLSGLLFIILGVVSREVASIAADIADSLLDANSQVNNTTDVR
jgi:hypothetical protein